MIQCTITVVPDLKRVQACFLDVYSPDHEFRINLGDLETHQKLEFRTTDFIGVYESTGCHTVDVSVRSLASLPASISKAIMRAL